MKTLLTCLSLLLLAGCAAPQDHFHPNTAGALGQVMEGRS